MQAIRSAFSVEFLMNSLRVILLLAVAILASACSEDGSSSHDATREVSENVINFSVKDRYTYVSTDASGSTEEWSIQEIVATNQEELEFRDVGTYRSSEEVQDVLNSLPYGFYEVELTVIGDSKIVYDKTPFIPSNTVPLQTRSYFKLSKYALRNFINSMDRGRVGSFVRSYFPSRISSKIDNAVLPELKKLLRQSEVFKDQVTTALTNGLIKAGASPAIARRVATFTTTIFL